MSRYLMPVFVTAAFVVGANAVYADSDQYTKAKTHSVSEVPNVAIHEIQKQGLTSGDYIDPRISLKTDEIAKNNRDRLLNSHEGNNGDYVSTRAMLKDATRSAKARAQLIKNQGVTTGDYMDPRLSLKGSGNQ